MTETTTRRDIATPLAIIGTGITLLAILVPMQLSFRSEVRNDVAELRREVHSLGERVARIEGRLDAVLPAITLMPELPADQ